MINAAKRLETVDIERLAAIERFSTSLHTFGPHPIPRSRQVANEYHRFHSPKAGHRIMECESGLESLVAFLGESDPEVTSITEQPLRIHGAIGNRPYHTLDIAFGYADGRVVYYEVKPEKHLKVHEDGTLAPANWPFIRAWAKANGFEVDFLTERKIWPRRQQIENGLIEVPITGTEPDEDSAPGELGLETPETFDRFDDYTVLTGWEDDS